MVSLVLTIIAFAGAMSVPAFLTAIVESAASKIRPSSSLTRALRRMNWIDRCRPVAMLLPVMEPCEPGEPLRLLLSNPTRPSGGGCRCCGADQSEPLRLLMPSAALHE
jgi:hypothetical protein